MQQVRAMYEGREQGLGVLDLLGSFQNLLIFDIWPTDSIRSSGGPTPRDFRTLTREEVADSVNRLLLFSRCRHFLGSSFRDWVEEADCADAAVLGQ